VLARIGGAAARRHMLASRLFDAAEAERIGLLAQAVAPEALDGAIEAEVAPFLECAPQAVAEAKALIRRLTPAIDAERIAATIELLVSRWQSPEAAEGIAAFLAKRKAVWAR